MKHNWIDSVLHAANDRVQEAIRAAYQEETCGEPLPEEVYGPEWLRQMDTLCGENQAYADG